MNKYNIIQYMLSAVENNYLEGLLFNRVEPSKFLMTATVFEKQRIKPVVWMIEANMYTRRDLLAESVKTSENSLEINSFEGITYIINVIAKK